MEAIARVRSSFAAAVQRRRADLLQDANGHRMMTGALGVPDASLGSLDAAHNEARLLYRHCGNLAQTICGICFAAAFPGSGPRMIGNPVEGAKPRRYEIDWLMPTMEALEFKWRDATTDGDHVRKERARLSAVRKAGFVPVRIMLFQPERKAARKIQAALSMAYEAEGGVYLAGPEAFGFVHRRTGIDLASCLMEAGRLA